MSNFILETKNLNKKFKNKKVLTDINLLVPRGKIYGLLGINGAGKSTLMKIIVGIITNYEGRIFYDDEKWNRKILNKIGSLIEYPTAYENLSAWDNMKICALEEKIDIRKINGVLDQLNIGNTGSLKVKSFSMGMKQRLGIAMAMLKDPNILILDEPFNGLDPYGIQELKVYLQRLTYLGKTVIISSHILPELQDIAEEIGIIDQGRLVYQDRMTKEQNLNNIFFEKTKRRV